MVKADKLVKRGRLLHDDFSDDRMIARDLLDEYGEFRSELRFESPLHAVAEAADMLTIAIRIAERSGADLDKLIKRVEKVKSANFAYSLIENYTFGLTSILIRRTSNDTDKIIAKLATDLCLELAKFINHSQSFELVRYNEDDPGSPCETESRDDTEE